MSDRFSLAPLSLLLALAGCSDYDVGKDTGGRSGLTDDEDWSDGSSDTADWGSDEDWGGDTGAPSDTEPDTDTATDPTCDDAVDADLTLYLSADDSNSQAAPVLARAKLEDGGAPSGRQRLWEYLNYYSFDYAPAEEGSLRVVAQARPGPEADTYDLLVAVVAPAADPAERRPLNLTFSVDTSGSMSGHPLEMAQETMYAVAASLQEGDVVSIVDWSSSPDVILRGEVVDGADDPDLMAAIAGLRTGGSTNLAAGLQTAYDVAADYWSADRTNRVILVSDGGANTGPTDEDLIGSWAADSEGEGIYLIGVGASDPSAYDDALMDTVTDLGRGAYLFVDSPSEAVRQFSGDRFLANLEVAAKDVQLAMTLPPGWVVDRFDGEEIGTDPDEVREQHLAPNDAMLYHMTLRDCGADPTEPLSFAASWREPRAAVDHVDAATFDMATMLDADSTQIDKAGAILAYARAFDEVWQKSGGERTAYLDEVYAVVQDAYRARPDDAELAEVLDLVATFRGRF